MLHSKHMHIMLLMLFVVILYLYHYYINILFSTVYTCDIAVDLCTTCALNISVRISLSYNNTI